MNSGKNKFVNLLGILFLFTACAGGGADYAAEMKHENTTLMQSGYNDATLDMKMEEEVVTPGTDYAGTPIPEMINRKLIKNANVSFETDSLNVRRAIIEAAVKRHKGYIAQEEIFDSYDRENVSTTVRIPTTEFDAFLKAATDGIGTFESRNISVNDVTEEYVDIAARIKTKKELKERFIALLDRAESIKKILEVEREIGALQAEIESYEGRMNYLQNNVAYATVTLTYFTISTEPIVSENRFQRAFFNGWDGLMLFFVGIVNFWPFWFILTLVLFVVRYQIKKRKQLRGSNR